VRSLPSTKREDVPMIWATSRVTPGCYQRHRRLPGMRIQDRRPSLVTRLWRRGFDVDIAVSVLHAVALHPDDNKRSRRPRPPRRAGGRFSPQGVGPALPSGSYSVGRVSASQARPWAHLSPVFHSRTICPTRDRVRSVLPPSLLIGRHRSASLNRQLDGSERAFKEVTRSRLVGLVEAGFRTDLAEPWSLVASQPVLSRRT
jgi:hypothetical protein